MSQKTEPSTEPCDISLSEYTVLPNNWKVSENHPNGIHWTNEKIRVGANSTVYFDRNVIMTACTIRMEKNAKIIVDDGYNITTEENTIFFACNTIWEGLQINEGCSYRFTNTEFRNAGQGLIMMPGNQSSYIFYINNCIIKNCTFRRNYISIKVHKNTGNTALFFLPSVFSGNTFISDGNDLGGEPFTIYYQKKSYTSISLLNCSLASISGNNFDNTGNGIIMENSYAIVQGASMKNMLDNGVYAKKSSLYLGNANIENVRIGVESNEGRGVTIKQCTIKNVSSRGIDVYQNNTFKPTVSIINNMIDCNKVPQFAIRVSRSPGFVANNIQNEISGNIILISGPDNLVGDAKVIDVSAPNGGTDKFPITYNTITISAQLKTYYSRHAIFITNNAGGYNVHKNIVNYISTNKPTSESPNLGIVFENVNGTNNSITENEVYATLFSNPVVEEGASWMKCAYHIDKSSNLVICNNKGDNTYRLFHFSGALNYCDFSLNNMNTHYYGIVCAKQPGSGNTNLGPQNWHENTWLGESSYMKFSALHKDFELGNTPFQFKVDPDFPSHMPSGANLTPPKVKPLNWFVIQNPNPPVDAENSTCIIDNFVEPNDHGWDTYVISDAYPYESISEKWDMKRELFFNLLNHPERRPANSPEQIWYDSMINSSEALFAQFEQSYLSAFYMSEAKQLELNDVRLAYFESLNELVYLDSLQSLDSLVSDSTLRQLRLGEIATNIDIYNELKFLTEESLTPYLATLDSIEVLLNDLPDSTVWELNRKTLYEMWLRQAKGDTLSSVDYQIARHIANQCPLEGGFAVREIPLMLPVPESYEYTREDYWRDCVDSVQNRKKWEYIGNNTLGLYPNPSSTTITFFKQEPGQSGEWAIIDISGKSWLNGSIDRDTASATINVNHLPAGIYFITLKIPDSKPFVAKFIRQF